jgi:hypothetical protein
VFESDVDAVGFAKPSAPVSFGATVEQGGLAKALEPAEAEERLDVYESLQIKMVYALAKPLVKAQLQTPQTLRGGLGVSEPVRQRRRGRATVQTESLIQ